MRQRQKSEQGKEMMKEDLIETNSRLRRGGEIIGSNWSMTMGKWFSGNETGTAKKTSDKKGVKGMVPGNKLLRRQ